MVIAVCIATVVVFMELSGLSCVGDVGVDFFFVRLVNVRGLIEELKGWVICV